MSTRSIRNKQCCAVQHLDRPVFYVGYGKTLLSLKMSFFVTSAPSYAFESDTVCRANIKIICTRTYSRTYQIFFGLFMSFLSFFGKNTWFCCIPDICYHWPGIPVADTAVADRHDRDRLKNSMRHPERRIGHNYFEQVRGRVRVSRNYATAYWRCCFDHIPHLRTSALPHFRTSARTMLCQFCSRDQLESASS